jgi:hypothetical protein
MAGMIRMSLDSPEETRPFGGPALFGSSAPVTGGGVASGTVDTP